MCKAVSSLELTAQTLVFLLQKKLPVCAGSRNAGQKHVSFYN